MSNDTELRRALTPEEWQHQKRVGVVKVRTGNLVVHGEVVDAEDCHALAALALYGQPFGFTREDVRLLHDVADGIDIPDDEEKALRALADRIAALLPHDSPPSP